MLFLSICAFAIAPTLAAPYTYPAVVCAMLLFVQCLLLYVAVALVADDDVDAAIAGVLLVCVCCLFSVR